MSIRKLKADDYLAFSQLWLEGLHECPGAFGEDVITAKKKTPEQWANWLKEHLAYGYFENAHLLGIIGAGTNKLFKKQHVIGVGPIYVHSSARRRGIAKQLLDVLIAELPPFAEQLKLAVNVDNTPARQLYEAFGFRAWGIEKQAMKLQNSSYVDAVWMTKILYKL